MGKINICVDLSKIPVLIELDICHIRKTYHIKLQNIPTPHFLYVIKIKEFAQERLIITSYKNSDISNLQKKNF